MTLTLDLLIATAFIEMLYCFIPSTLILCSRC